MKRQRGFSLLEVIAAMLLLAITFAALMKVAGGAIALSRNAAVHCEAVQWARSKLDSAFVAEPLQPGSSSGRFNRQFQWQLNVTPWQPAAAPAPAGPAQAQTPAQASALRLYQLDLAVSWGAPAHRQTAHFRTLRLVSAAPSDQGGNAP